MTDKPVILVGAGGHAWVLADALVAAGRSVLGAVAPEPPLELPERLAYLGDDQVVLDHDPGEILLANAVGSVADPRRRIAVFERFHEAGYRFASVVHPSAVVARDVLLDEGVQVMAGAVIQPACRLGVNTLINTRASMDHHCRLGTHIHVAPGAVLCGAVVVGDRAHIGPGATVAQGLAIGAGSVVAAGAVVLRPVPAGVRVQGIPAQGVQPSVNR